ncbi:Aste57867_18825 [Aphanomyces stellatus]|uniref:Aste57867_18825 protein n=1 Tax=Aphanomyces stellatus TaxID=120398 RepID=A0A485LBF2_9STRA|nr:hypothetical protein As57867_018761 [Aphanomyces stellatus]VFT95559.1 Aste57867_18825 [Aphanomyces stellatus]
MERSLAHLPTEDDGAAIAAQLGLSLEELGLEFEFEMDADSLSRAYFECAAEGNVETMQLLLSHDIHNELLNSVDVDGFSALMIAAAEGNRDVVLELLKRNANANLRTFELKSAALHFAAKNGDPVIVEEMCKHTTQIDFWNINADTPLVWACIEGRDEAVAILLGHGADPRVTNHYGATTLMCATMIGEDTDEESDLSRRRIVEMLLDKHPELVNVQDRDGSTAMHLAASCGYLQCCHALLAGGADITIRNIVGQTPLEEAEQTGCEGSGPCVAFLKIRWAQLEEEVNARMRTMLEMEEGGGDTATTPSASKASKKKKKQKKAAAKKKSTKATPLSSKDDDDDGGGIESEPSDDEALPPSTSTSKTTNGQDDAVPARVIEPREEDETAWTTVTRKPEKKATPAQEPPKDHLAPKPAPRGIDKKPIVANDVASVVRSQPSSPQKRTDDKVVSPAVRQDMTRELPPPPVAVTRLSPPRPLAIKSFAAPSLAPQTAAAPPPSPSSIPFFQYRPTSRLAAAAADNPRRGNYRRGAPVARPAKLGWLHQLEDNVRDALSVLACGQCGDWINDNLQCPHCQQLYCARCVPSLCGRCGCPLAPTELKHNVLAQQQAACMGLVKLSQEKAAVSLEVLERQMHAHVPLSEHVALTPRGLVPGQTGYLAHCSMGQLDVLEEMHHMALRELNEARVALVRAQERLKFEQEYKTQFYLQSLDAYDD